MDLLASRVIDGKSKPRQNKKLKRLSKDDSKKIKTIPKEVSKKVEKIQKKQKSKQDLKNISNKKKKLIKDTLVETQIIGVKNLSKEIVSNKTKKTSFTEELSEFSKQTESVTKNKVKNSKDNVISKSKITKLPKTNFDKDESIGKIKNISKKTKSGKSKTLNKNLAKDIKSSKKFETQAIKSTVMDENACVIEMTKGKLPKHIKKALASLKNNSANLEPKTNPGEIQIIKPTKADENVNQSTKGKEPKAAKKTLASLKNKSADLETKIKSKIDSTKLVKEKIKSKKMDENLSTIVLAKEKVDKNMKKTLANLKNKSNKLDTQKKVKSELSESIKIQNNVEIKNVKSKKRKLSDSQEEKSNIQKDLNLKKKEVEKFVKALLELVKIEEQGKKNLFSSEKLPILLRICCFKIPKTPLHQKRLILPHSLVASDDDVALFVKDLRRGRKIDYEDTVHHYEDILRQHDCTQVKTIIPINQVRTEYRQFEMRRRLFSSYDYFLCDGRISGQMAHLLGKQFTEKRKLPTSIQMDKENLKKEIDEALKKTVLQIHSKGDSYTVQIATCSMSIDEIVDNILKVVNDLNKDFPGGWENIRELGIKTSLSIQLPMYLSLKCKNDIETPVILPKRPKAYKDVSGELSTFTSNTNVIVTPDGNVIVQKVGKDNDDDTDDETIKIEDEVKDEIDEEVESENEEENDQDKDENEEDDDDDDDDDEDESEDDDDEDDS